jgi:hypothetical protein
MNDHLFHYRVSWDVYGTPPRDEYETQSEALVEFQRGVQKGVPISVWEKMSDGSWRRIALFPGII